MSIRSRIVLSFLSVATLTIGVIGWSAYERFKAVVRIEATIAGAAYPATYRWIDVPKSIDRKITEALSYLAPDERWPAYCERAWPYLVGSDTLLIYVDSLQGDLAQALTQYSDLDGLRIEGKDDRVTSSDWNVICTAVRALPKLDWVVLQGPTIVDDSIAPLSGHPSIGIVKIDLGRITPSSIATFSSMPSLKELAIEELLRFTPGERKAFQDALPHVAVILN
jgi:hypothetical protein